MEICEYNDIFHLSYDKLTCKSTTEHSIPTPNIDPHRTINLRPYRIPQVHRAEVQKHKMLADVIIQLSTSPWNSPILVVPKKIDVSGKTKWRVVVDFRKLNDVTVVEFSHSCTFRCTTFTGKSKYFSTVDCASDFWQIPVGTEDRPKTAFCTENGH